MPLGVRDENDGLPCSQGNGDAGNFLGNPTGLKGRTNSAYERRGTSRTPRTRKGGRRTTELTGQLGKEKNGDTCAFRHAPGGTWLMKDPRTFCLVFPDPSALYQSRPWDGVCSWLSENPAPDAPEWRMPLGVRGEKDGLPYSQGNGDAGNFLGNPELRVPDRTEREDGLRLREEEDEQNAENVERRETDDGGRNGNSVVPSELTGQLGKEKNSDTRAFRHAPGGTWITKVRSFFKDSIFTKGESDGRRVEGRDSTERGEGRTLRRHRGDEQE
ncbi:hypothetical protein NDU88_007116 [Pleurodeles waltl]|uniref:Uncharacterized protein n=1 Tax=Pleurodeles waltl TaxID=8319 RepID=A0AAV7SRW2_PLEWA|nr:hypothetical protein NDU88_007116 [Pleurodeles waltl]